MPLKITKASERIEVKTIVTCIYGQPGIGKTTMGFTAGRTLLIDADKGSYRAANRKDVVQVDNWSDVTTMGIEELKEYDTIVVDTVGRALDTLTVAIIQGNPKQGRNGALTLQGYGELKSTFLQWMNLVKSMGKDIVLICHSTEEHRGDDTVERLDVQGGTKQEIPKSSDQIGRIKLVGGKRVLSFSPVDNAFGKNPAQFEDMEVPDAAVAPNFLGDLIKRCKDHLNKMSDEQRAAANALGGYQEQISKATSMTDLDGLLPVVRSAPTALQANAKRLLVQRAKALGFVYVKSTDAFDLAPPAGA